MTRMGRRVAVLAVAAATLGGHVALGKKKFGASRALDLIQKVVGSKPAAHWSATYWKGRMEHEKQMYEHSADHNKYMITQLNRLHKAFDVASNHAHHYFSAYKEMFKQVSHWNGEYNKMLEKSKKWHEQYAKVLGIAQKFHMATDSKKNAEVAMKVKAKNQYAEYLKQKGEQAKEYSKWVADHKVYIKTKELAKKWQLEFTKDRIAFGDWKKKAVHLQREYGKLLKKSTELNNTSKTLSAKYEEFLKKQKHWHSEYGVVLKLAQKYHEAVTGEKGKFLKEEERAHKEHGQFLEKKQEALAQHKDYIRNRTKYLQEKTLEHKFKKKYEKDHEDFLNSKEAVAAWYQKFVEEHKKLMGEKKRVLTLAEHLKIAEKGANEYKKKALADTEKLSKNRELAAEAQSLTKQALDYAKRATSENAQIKTS